MTIITVVTRDREWTATEQATVDAANNDAIAAGNTFSNYAASTLTDFPRTNIRIWTNTDSANAYVAMLNGFTPPPPQAVVQTI